MAEPEPEARAASETAMEVAAAIYSIAYQNT